MAGVNKSVDVPTWCDPAFSDTVNETRSLRGFDVWSAGNVKWTDHESYTQARTFAAPFPIRITGHVARIWSTGTTVTTTDIAGLH